MSTIEHLLANCPHLGSCHREKAIEIDQALRAGIPFTALGGKRVRCRRELVRFRLGSEWRLLYLTEARGYTAHRLINRQSLTRELKRRRAPRP